MELRGAEKIQGGDRADVEVREPLSLGFLPSESVQSGGIRFAHIVLIHLLIHL
jgi:hypothetical protein